jgi:PKD repeat protein
MNPFGDGSNGALNVTSGTTNLLLNTKYQFTTVNVSAGATLSTNSTTGSVLYITARESITINGTINVSNKVIAGRNTWSVTIDGVTYNSPGVANGANGRAYTGATAGSTVNGFGGGGTGAGATLNSITYNAGDGGNGSASSPSGGARSSASRTTNGTTHTRNDGVRSRGGSGVAIAYIANKGSGTANVSATSGAGGANYGSNGETGVSATVSGTASFTGRAVAGGGGGAGGIAGKAGVNVVLSAPVVIINGTIITSGTNGGNGGDGGRARDDDGLLSFYGQPGGGGGGGSAGAINITYAQSYTSGTYIQSGGSGGIGGEGGATGNTKASDGSNGLVAGDTQEQVKPFVDFTGTPVTGARPLNVNFTNASLGADSYLWDFGDSNTSTSINPSHTYTTVGTFTVTLTATNDEGDSVKTRTAYITTTTQNFAREAKGTLVLGGGVTRSLSAFRSAGGTLLLGGEAGGFIIRDAVAIESKTYLYKVYDEEGNYIEVWGKDIASEPTFTQEINEIGSVMEIELARNSDTLGQSVAPLLDEDGNPVLTEASQNILASVTSKNQVGPGSSVNHNNRVDVFVFYGAIEPLLAETGEEITTEDGEVILAVIGAPNGRRIFTGFISEISSRYGGTETTVIQLMSYGYDLKQYAIMSGANTRVTYNTQDPSNIVKDAMSKFETATAGDFTYTTTTPTSIQNTSTSVSYTFNVNSYGDVLKKSLELMPSNWYFRIGLGDNIVYFDERASEPQHKFFLGKHIKELDLKSYIGGVVNDVLYVGGGDPALYRRSTETPADRTRRGLAIESDARVTVTASADIIAEGIIEQKNKIQYRSVVTILDKQYDIESINVGDMVGFRNFGNYVDELMMQVVALTYTPDFVQLQLDSMPPTVNKRLEDIRRNLNTVESTNTPNSPS